MGLPCIAQTCTRVAGLVAGMPFGKQSSALGSPVVPVRRRASSNLTKSVYTHLGLVDERAALERVFGAILEVSESELPIARATGTTDAIAETGRDTSQHSPQQSPHESVRSSANVRDNGAQAVVGRISSQVVVSAGSSGRVRRGASGYQNRGDRTPVELFVAGIRARGSEIRDFCVLCLSPEELSGGGA